jgi:hypothetical protein
MRYNGGGSRRVLHAKEHFIEIRQVMDKYPVNIISGKYRVFKNIFEVHYPSLYELDIK